MTKKILFILLFQVLAFSSYSQGTITEPERSKRIIEISPTAVVDPPPCEGCPLGYQWNKDFDKDGFGDPAQVLYSQKKPNGYVANQQDCNDNDATINPNTIWYRDADGDGYGVSTPRLVQCLQPTGYVRNSSDLNDSNPNIINVPPQTYYRDADGDGFGNPGLSLSSSTKPSGYVADQQDCNDADFNINPNTIWYRDLDGDTYGSSSIYINSCTQPSGYVRNSADYDDSNVYVTNITPQFFYRDADGDGWGSDPSVYRSVKPDGYVTNKLDYDDTTRNINNIAPQTFYEDADLDGYGNPAVSVYYSIKPYNWVTNNADCNDADVAVNPNTFWYLDADGDGYGNYNSRIRNCAQPTGYVRNDTDCNDADASLNPSTVWYRDQDADGYGDNAIVINSCTQPAGYVRNNSDCNDSSAATNPSLIWYRDLDQDGYGNPGLTKSSCAQPAGYVSNNQDCDDYHANVNPDTVWYRDADGDGFGKNASTIGCVQPQGYVLNNNDCNDADATLNPNTVWYRDADADGYGNIVMATNSCTQPGGYVLNAFDYDDSTGNITSIEPRYFYQDIDGDGFGNPAISVYYSAKPSGYVSNNADYNDTTANITNIAPQTFYQDTDGDGFGNPNVSVYYSLKPSGYVSNNADFNDTTVTITNIAPQNFYQDTDGDGFGNALVYVYYSNQPANFVTDNTDCNDTDASLNPNTKWYADNDLDGLGDSSSYILQCTLPNGNYVRDNTDNCPLIKGTNTDCSNIVTPSTDYNYIITKTYKEPSATLITAPSSHQVQTNITYFDGLGRPMQQIANSQSASGKDIITHIGYDDFGRQVQEYLPYAASSTNMAFEENAKNNTSNFYNNDTYQNTDNPFSEKKLESSPLNRVLKQAAPGNSWAMNSGHEIKLDYQTNTTTAAATVKLYRATASWQAGSGLYEINLSEDGTYVAGELYKTITYDENTTATPIETAGATIEFKNKEGQVVLKRTYAAGDKHDTYYVYDLYGNLTYVLPPKVSGAISPEVLNGLCYQYKYDYRNRLVEKKLPGKQWEFIVYDKLDRPVATGPAFSPFKDETAQGWLITKYDAFGRPVYTGWSNQTCTSAARKSWQDAQNGAKLLFESKETSGTIDGISVNYSNNIEPKDFKLLTVNYYDNYAYPNAPAVPTSIEGETVLVNTKTLATGSWTRAVTTTAAILGETSTTFYDAKARPIGSYTQNHLGGYTSANSKIDFSGKTVYTLTKHKRSSGDTELSIREEFTYTPQDRLLTHTHQINGGTVMLLAANEYDELGQLKSKSVGNSTGNPMQKVNFSYNIRGWLTEINKIDNLQQDTDPVDLFAFKLNYDNDPTNPAVTKLYNGNIAETFWKTASDNAQRGYGYQYDNLNRLTNAMYAKNGLVTNAYKESLSYDKNGNILSLGRNGDIDPQIQPFEMDNLVYDYPANSNQLTKVDDNANNTSGFNDANKSGEDYSYDANGNMITDKNKNITQIQYNQLNLPKKITFGTTGGIEYIYNATGQKLRKIVTEGAVETTTDYLGGFQYKDNVLQFFPTAEGYVKNSAGVLSYVFQYKDHLGNVRLSYAKNPVTNVLEIIEENNYYPFGLKHKGYNDYVATDNKYKYNGKELQDELGLNMYDYSARNYDPALGRWMNIDPLAEKSRRWSPYNYAMDNPVYFLDPDGMLSKSFMDDLIKKSNADGETKWTNNDDGTFSGSNGKTADTGESTEESGGDKEGQEGPGKGKIVNLPKKGDKVLVDVTAKTPLGKIWSFIQGDRDWTDSTTGLTYVVGDDGSILRIKPLGGAGGLEYISGLGEVKLAIQFGKDANQVYHAFRHVEEMGLAQSAVKAAIKAHFPTVVARLEAGKPLNSIIEVAGHRIQYTAYKLADGTINIGRIHGI